MKRLAYRISELADALGVPASTIRGWIARREIASRRIGRVVLVPAAELERLLGTPEPGAPARAPEVRREASKLLSGMVGP